MRQASLPPELWLEIISFLAAKQCKIELCALSTQSRRFRALCVPHIFSDFTARIDYRGRHRDAEPGLRRCTLWDLETFLSSNVQIQESVRCLRISVWKEGEETWLDQEQHWNPELVLRILKSLPSLEELHIRDLLIGTTDMAAPALQKLGAVDLRRLHIELSRNLAPHAHFGPRFRRFRAVPLPWLHGLMSIFADVESVVFEDLRGINVTATPDTSAALAWPSNLKTRSLTASEDTPWAMIVKGVSASSSAHLLTSLEVGDDPSFRVMDGVLAAAIRVLGPNLTHLGIWSEALPNSLTLHGLVEDWDKIVFAHCRNLRSLALYLNIASQRLLRDPDYAVSRGSGNMWYGTRRVLKHMLIGTAIAGRSSSAGLGDEESGVGGGGGGKGGARGGQDDADDDDESGDGDDHSPPTTFVPGTLRSITLKLTARCYSDACICTDDALRAHFAMQRKMFAWVESPLLRFLELPGFECVRLELLPNSNIARGRETVPRYLAHLLLPPCFPRLHATGKLRVKEFARWV